MEALKDNPLTTTPTEPEQLAPAPRVATQFGITRRTLSRWIVDPNLAFPQPVEINRRLYFKQLEVDAWKLARAVFSVREAA